MSLKSQVWIILSVCVLQTVSAQEAKMEATAYSTELKADVKAAIAEAGMSRPDAWADAFESTYADPAAGKLFETGVNSDQRVRVIAKYLQAKSSLVGYADVDNIQVSDFNWAYVGSDFSFLPMEIQGASKAVLISTNVDDQIYNFNPYGRMALGMANGIVMPFTQKSGSSGLSAEFIQAGKLSVWSGFADWQSSGAIVMKVPTALDSNAVIVDVSSTPPGAAVYINSKKIYKPTNLELARPPGVIELTLKMDGYNDWTETKDMLTGETWVVNTTLILLDQ